MARRATRTTWVLRRMRALGVDQGSLVTYWKADGPVHLELVCPVWHSGLTTQQSRDLDRAQRVAMVAITVSPFTPGSYRTWVSRNWRPGGPGFALPLLS